MIIHDNELDLYGYDTWIVIIDADPFGIVKVYLEEQDGD